MVRFVSAAEIELTSLLNAFQDLKIRCVITVSHRWTVMEPERAIFG